MLKDSYYILFNPYFLFKSYFLFNPLRSEIFLEEIFFNFGIKEISTFEQDYVAINFIFIFIINIFYCIIKIKICNYVIYYYGIFIYSR